VGITPKDDEPAVLVPLSTIRSIEEDLEELLPLLEALTRKRPVLLRVLRELRELDPDRTPIKPTSADAFAAFKKSSDFLRAQRPDREDDE